MTRIIGGAAGGRRLRTPPGDRTRPTSDRVREALFSSLVSWAGSLNGLRVLDLYAGSGAVGLEAHSRGAGHVTWVESDRRTAALVRANAAVVDLERPDVRAASVASELAHPPTQPYDLVFSDPPYDLAEDAVARDLALLVAWVRPGGLVVVERSVRSPAPQWPAAAGGPDGGPGALEAGRERRYGETVLWYGHRL